jgi:HK97 family phage major capsid protein
MSNNRSKVKAFTGPMAEQKAERVGHWFRALTGNENSKSWCIQNGVGLQKASNELTDTAGGYLAPQEFDNAVAVVRESMGAFRASADVRPTRSDNQIRPRSFGTLTASYTAEGAAITESSLTLDAVEVSLRKFAILAKCSSELFEDSPVDLASYLTGEIGYALASKEDDCAFNGDGTSTYAGISGIATKLSGLKSSVAAASGHNTFATLDSTDVANLVAGIIGAAVPGASFFASITAYGQLFCRLAGTSGALVSNLLPDGSLEASYMGHPIKFSGKLPDSSSSLAGSPCCSSAIYENPRCWSSGRTR